MAAVDGHSRASRRYIILQPVHYAGAGDVEIDSLGQAGHFSPVGGFYYGCRRRPPAAIGFVVGYLGQFEDSYHLIIHH